MAFEFWKSGIQKVGEPAYKGSEDNLLTVIANGIEVFLSVLGIVFLILMLYGGFMWFNARGDTGDVKKAVQLIQQAVIGLAIVFGSYALTYFIFEQVLKVSGITR